jgi:acetylornithine/N-succinyldiaminopimelate aminotransferase
MGVTPDILSSAKGLGGGFPIAAMLTTRKLAAHFPVGSHGTTYGGNPLACAVAAEVLDILSARNTLSGVKKRHAAFVAGLEALDRRHGAFREIRGMGLLLGCELKDAWKGKAKDLVKLAEKQGLIVLQAGPDVIRFAPSLLIPLADVKAGLRRFEAAVAEFVAQPVPKAA